MPDEPEEVVDEEDEPVADPVESIKDLLGQKLVQALKGKKVGISDSVLRASATYLRLYDTSSRSAGKHREPPEKVVQEIGRERGSVPIPPFSSIDQEVEN